VGWGKRVVHSERMGWGGLSGASWLSPISLVRTTTRSVFSGSYGGLSHAADIQGTCPPPMHCSPTPAFLGPCQLPFSPAPVHVQVRPISEKRAELSLLPGVQGWIVQFWVLLLMMSKPAAGAERENTRHGASPKQ
jgi:hypothetical protein